MKFCLFFFATDKQAQIPPCRASHRGDQGGPLVPLGEKKKNKGGPGGTSLPLSVPKLPIRNFPHFLNFFLPSRPRASKYRQLTGGKDGTKKVLWTKTAFHNGICKATGGVPSYLLRKRQNITVAKNHEYAS